MDYQTAEPITDAYNSMRERASDLAKADPSLMGDYAWLASAMSTTDITITASKDGLNCWGYAYTVQTMDSEWFDFTIPYERF